MRGITWLAEDRLGSEEGFCSTEWESNGAKTTDNFAYVRKVLGSTVRLRDPYESGDIISFSFSCLFMESRLYALRQLIYS